jgi:ribosomal protein S18 acetylase RimI-like enzyme
MTEGRLLESLQLEVSASLRVATRADLAPLEWGGVFADHRQLILEAFDRQQQGEVLIIVADVGGVPAGQIWVDFAKRRSESVGVLWALRVMPALRCVGFGTRLIRCAERCLVARGYLSAEIAVEDNNPDARRLYERLGYRAHGRTSEELVYQRPDGHEVRMQITTSLLRKWLPGGQA